jgi:hypothetical protein
MEDFTPLFDEKIDKKSPNYLFQQTQSVLRNKK